jgi:pyocin large subunit-like protein
MNKMPKIQWNLKTILTIIAVVVVLYLAFTGKIPLFSGGDADSDITYLPIGTEQADSGTQAASASTQAASQTAQPAATQAATKAATEPAATQKPYKDYYFRSSKLLNEHYEKHGKEMGFKSAKDYEKAASDVINNPDALTKREKEDNDYVYYIEATNEFVILSEDGYIRTYFLPSAGKAYYDRQ